MSLRGRRRGRRGLPVNAEISITNLVDVAFVLLIVFMITAPILQGGIEVRQRFVPGTRPLCFSARFDQGVQHVMLLGVRQYEKKCGGLRTARRGGRQPDP